MKLQGPSSSLLRGPSNSSSGDDDACSHVYGHSSWRIAHNKVLLPVLVHSMVPEQVLVHSMVLLLALVHTQVLVRRILAVQEHSID